jgi:glycosyltransferase involved in cell wall biosynthesis
MSVRKIRVVLDPVDMERFKPMKVEKEWDVMFHGYLNKNKGIEMLLEVARRLPELRFCIIGDGPGAWDLVQQAPENVDFQGWVAFKDMPQVLNMARVGVAMRSKNMGNEYVYTQPYLQYSACGVPVVVSRRKVFGNYRWQFDNVDELELCVLEGGQVCDVSKHDARRIADELSKLIVLRGFTDQRS